MPSFKLRALLDPGCGFFGFWIQLYIHCQKSKHIVGGSEIRRVSAPVEVGSFIPLFTRFYASQVVGNGISEPSTVLIEYIYIYTCLSRIWGRLVENFEF